MADERFPLVDEDGNVIGSAIRKEVHGNPALIHPVVHCLITDRQGRLLLQLRSRDKDVQPGRWDTSMGGHVDLGETIEQALRRELSEELGIDVDTAEARFLYRYVMRSEVETELVYTYHASAPPSLTRAEEEIEELRYWTLDEIDAALGTGVLTPNFEDEYRRFRALGPLR